MAAENKAMSMGFGGGDGVGFSNPPAMATNGTTVDGPKERKPKKVKGGENPGEPASEKAEDAKEQG